MHRQDLHSFGNAVPGHLLPTASRHEAAAASRMPFQQSSHAGCSSWDLGERSFFVWLCAFSPCNCRVIGRAVSDQNSHGSSCRWAGALSRVLSSGLHRLLCVVSFRVWVFQKLNFQWGSVHASSAREQTHEIQCVGVSVMCRLGGIHIFRPRSAASLRLVGPINARAIKQIPGRCVRPQWRCATAKAGPSSLVLIRWHLISIPTLCIRSQIRRRKPVGSRLPQVLTHLSVRFESATSHPRQQVLN